MRSMNDFSGSLFVVFVFITTNAENITTFLNSGVQFDEETNKFLNNSNSELIEYYDTDDISSAPEVIYPDPDTVFNTKKKENQKSSPHLDDELLISSITTAVSSVDDTAMDINQKNNEYDSMQGHKLQFHDDMKNEDLKEHDIIDNIMYIYYGSSVAMRKSLGGSIIIVGTVFALAAQILAIVFTLLRNRQLRRVNNLATISFNLLLTLCASNLVFIVGVQASKNIFKCEMIAVLLHYFHLSTAIWGLCHTFTIYDYVINENAPVIKYNNLFAYGGSGVFVLFSFAISSSSYEITDYCWMSVQRGMIINFMIPTSILIVATTIFGTMTLRTVVSKQRQVIVESIENILEKCQHIDATVANANALNLEQNLTSEYVPTVKCCEEMEKVCENELKSVDFYDSKFDLGALSIADLSLQSSSDSQDFAEFKRAIKFSLFFQPAFSVCWFLGVVALENRQSCIMPVTFIISYNILNWYILYRFPNISPLIVPAQPNNENNLKNCNKALNQFDSNYSISDDANQTPSCTDTIPLLCSVTGGGGGGNIGVTGTAISIQSPNGVFVSKQLSMEDIIYKTSMSQWDASMENNNLDCISTISN